MEISSFYVYKKISTEDEKEIITKIRNAKHEYYLMRQAIPHPYTLYMLKPDFFAYGKKQHNSLGFRGKEIKTPKTGPRIFCLGGSTTYGWRENDPEWTYPSQMERYLQHYNKNIEVINAGLIMGTTAEILTTFHFRVLPLKPDLVLLLIGLNDIFPELMPNYKPDYTHERNAWLTRKTSLIMKYNFLLNSNIIKLVYLFHLRRTEYSELHADFINPERWKWKEFCKDGDADNPKRYSGFRNNLKSLLAIAERNNVKVIMTPTYIRQDIKTEYPALHRAYLNNIKIMKDLSGEFPNALFYEPTYNIPEEYHIDWCHLDRRGLEIQAKAFAEFIISNKLLERFITDNQTYYP